MNFAKMTLQKKMAIAVGVALVLALAAFLGVHIHQKSAAKNAVLDRLKDPESAVFGEYTKVGDGACLGVNAKNAMGGYVGQQQAHLDRRDGEWLVSSFEEVSHTQCVSNLKENAAANASVSDICKKNDELIERLRKDGRDTASLEQAGKSLGCK